MRMSFRQYSFNAVTMKLMCFLICITYVSCFYTISDINRFRKMKIFGGRFERIELAPYQASLEYIGELICGAVIISKKWLLSAGHCLLGLDDPLINLKVRTGTQFKESGGEVFNLKYIIIHRDYNNSFIFEADIALLKVANPIKFNDERSAIPISSSSDDPIPSTPMKISGFGSIHHLLRNRSSMLKSATVEVLPRPICIEKYAHEVLSNRLFCATSFPNDSCVGDSGGPGVINGKLVAIVSSGFYCGIKGFPSVYIKVGAFYNWILKKTGFRL